MHPAGRGSPAPPPPPVHVDFLPGPADRQLLQVSRDAKSGTVYEVGQGQRQRHRLCVCVCVCIVWESTRVSRDLSCCQHPPPPCMLT